MSEVSYAMSWRCVNVPGLAGSIAGDMQQPTDKAMQHEPPHVDSDSGDDMPELMPPAYLDSSDDVMPTPYTISRRHSQ